MKREGVGKRVGTKRKEGKDDLEMGGMERMIRTFVI